MLIDHPILGPRDAAEFVYKGDAMLIHRPDWQAEDAVAQFTDYGYLRDNPAGRARELWYHEAGCTAWLVVERDTVTHDVFSVGLVERADAD